MKQHIKKVPRWLVVMVFFIIVFSLAYLGSTLGSTVSQTDSNQQQIKEIKRLQVANRRISVNAAIAGCKAVLHSDQVFTKFSTILKTGTRANDPFVQDLAHFLDGVVGDDGLCKIAERRSGHRITIHTTTTTEGR